ncbi:hypothetical protein BaRGS_00038679 [Batillaria attramentaria]|uniref:Uncharacterized protein n=1 Tax=Batillaria attramentaria TaxID=370345 RepID=A0ABD0J6H6_9CAEN
MQFVFDRRGARVPYAEHKESPPPHTHTAKSLSAAAVSQLATATGNESDPPLQTRTEIKTIDGIGKRFIA